MKLNKLAIAVGALVLSGSALAELSANIGATSNYVWRGTTQTQNSAAVSGGIDWGHDSGFYLGTWAANVEFADETGAEVDFYGGFSSEVGSLGYDIGAIYYYYPNYDDSDFTEIYGSLSFGPVTAGINYTIDTDAGGDDDHIYYFAEAATDISNGWGIGGVIGYYDFDGDGGSYTHYGLNVTKSAGDFGDFTFSVSKASDDDAGVDEDTLVFVSWGKTFE